MCILMLKFFRCEISRDTGGYGPRALRCLVFLATLRRPIDHVEALVGLEATRVLDNAGRDVGLGEELAPITNKPRNTAAAIFESDTTSGPVVLWAMVRRSKKVATGMCL